MERNFKHAIVHSAVVFLGFLGLYTLFFSPVLFSNRLLAPGDGISYFLPAFYSAKTLWTNLIFSGYPIAADPQNMTWYPPAFLLGLIPHSWNAFVVLAYVLAASFSFYYVYILTNSNLAATIAGIVYSMSGFMIGHLSMASMIHAAAWIPLILCALEKLRHRLGVAWFAVCAIAIACCFLAGHPQIFVYGMGIFFVYVLFLGWDSPIGRWKYYRWLLTAVILGIGLSGIQLVPTIELSDLSLRAEMPYSSFVSYSLPLWQALQLFFPFLFGGYTGSATTYSPYWGEWVLAEIQGYVGILPLILAGIGAIAYPNRSIAKFWLLVGFISLIMVFGDPLLLGGKLAYYIPIYNKFRIPGRHFMEFSLSISVLCGLGISLIQQKIVSKNIILKAIKISFILMLFCLSVIYFFQGSFKSKAAKIGISHLSFLPWTNPAIGIPVVTFLLGIAALVVWTRWYSSRWVSIGLVAVVILDISSLGTCWDDWKLFAPSTDRLELSSEIKAEYTSLKTNHQRFLDVDGASGDVWTPSGIFPNLTRLWGLPNAGGYSPLMIARVSEMLKMASNGALSSIPILVTEHQLDLTSVRYLLANFSEMIQQKGLIWSDTTFPSLASGTCASFGSQSSITLDLKDVAYDATAIGIVTQLGCSVEVPDQAEVAQIEVTDAQGNVETHSLLAGRDTAEYAYDCPDVKPAMQHQRAQIFRSVPTSRPGGGACEGHEYVAMVRLNRSQQISNLKLNWANLPAVMNIQHISLINEPQGTSLPLTSLGLSKKWRKVEQISSGIIYENQQVMPRAWLVPETIVLKPEEVLTAVHTSELPDGRTYDPKTMALVEDGTAQFQSSALQPTDTVKVVSLEETRVELQTQASAPAFLVLSDVFYPGWRATIDGKRTPIFQTNYIQRGVKLPAGEHMVRFEFHPLSFKLGVGITMASLFGGGYWLFRAKKDPAA
jgi:hypothetical protein